MKIDDVIEKLREIQKIWGNLPVVNAYGIQVEVRESQIIDGAPVVRIS